jgi:hypothetical protein
MNPLPDHYRSTVRSTLRFALLMVLFALITGVLFQESSKKLDYGKAAPGLHLEAVLHLALVHGHAFLVTVLLPIAMAGALLLARKAGGGEVSPRATAFLVRGYLPFGTAAVALMLYKGYAVLLAVRGGNTDLGDVYAGLFGGVKAIRYSVYGVVHIGMAVTLGWFCVALWRSLGRARAAE